MKPNTITRYVSYAAMVAVFACGAYVVAPTSVSAQYYDSGYGGYGGVQPTFYDPIFISDMFPSFTSYTPAYSYPTHQPSYPRIHPLTVSCRSDYTQVRVGSNVLWIAYASGGSGSYTYTWSGSDGLSGSSRSVYATYVVPGQKGAAVTVRSSDGQIVTQQCSNTVTVSGPHYQPVPIVQPVPVPVYQAPVITRPALDVGCYADPTTAVVGQPITWNVEVKNGFAPYTYSWTGSDGLTGNQASIIKYYTTAGIKSAIVIVTSADGASATRACSNTVTVRAPVPPAKSVAKPPAKKPVYKDTCERVTYCERTRSEGALQVTRTHPPQTTSVVEQAQANATNSTLFSLGNVPWGWVAILVILVLFFTVIYLIFNRQKI